MRMEIESDDREAVENAVLAKLWGPETVRLTADVVDGHYIVSMHSVDGEPDGQAPDATPLSS